eukprot:scaffold49868_cov57-Phaeocystis_antarctica.AAC.2
MQNFHIAKPRLNATKPRTVTHEEPGKNSKPSSNSYDFAQSCNQPGPDWLTPTADRALSRNFRSPYRTGRGPKVGLPVFVAHAGRRSPSPAQYPFAACQCEKPGTARGHGPERRGRCILHWYLTVRGTKVA